ncbi:MAG: NUDIX hydrolase [Ignavibacteriae bacterium HGW-Ignavibacteriae-2]|jgi:colanic acid biosynthesis protein WcaH|nr:MAG: NUDIX hydrolase [Ignavibacteriae bacterium HGW-Ignavibacteriae-2]
MNVFEAIKYIEEQVSHPEIGLPEEIFHFVSRHVPMVNVDLLIKDENKRTLLAWRDDEFAGTGWHIPGGIIRFKEKLETRIKKTAENEIGAIIKYDPEPLAINQVICQQDTRGHFISLLYKCFLPGNFVPINNLTENEPGYLKWHDYCPDNLVHVHDMYRKYI